MHLSPGELVPSSPIDVSIVGARSREGHLAGRIRAIPFRVAIALAVAIRSDDPILPLLLQSFNLIIDVRHIAGLG